MSDFPVSAYSVTLGRLPMVGMSADPATWCVAGIRCRQATSGAFLDIGFIPAGIPLPANTSAGNWHISYRPVSELASYLDLLRNEGPILMALDPAKPERHSIHTASFEPVGEGE